MSETSNLRRLGDFIGLGFWAVIHLEREIMATVQELKDAVNVLQTSVQALEAAEAAEAAPLPAGQVAIAQSDLDALHQSIVDAQGQVDAVTAQDVADAAPPADVPPAG